MNMNLLQGLEILQVYSEGASAPAIRAADVVSQLAIRSGARVYVSGEKPLETEAFYHREKQRLDDAASPASWAKAEPNRVVLIASTDDEYKKISESNDLSAVVITTPPWHSEATLFAQCGLADLLGDPDREPLVPAGYYASGTIGLAGFTALLGVYAKQQRFNRQEVAHVDGLSVMAWTNWKAGAAGLAGDEYHREGSSAEWPVLPCKDGHIAFVYTERDWDNVVKMIGDHRLSNERFSTFEGRAKHRDDYMAIVREWAQQTTKAEFADLCLQHAIPGAPVSTISDLLAEPLLNHRDAFETIEGANGKTVKTPIAPYRARSITATGEASEDSTDAPPVRANLPLAGKRILDMGIITAGAGTSGLLADMGAEVIKIESPTYPDPFRLWAGAEDESPLFNFNNRNKFGVALDLKNPDDRQRFFQLVKSADAVVENFRRGVMERLGITLETLREHNPKIVLASISGQGLDGPGADHTTYGSTLEALSGFAALTAYEDIGLPYITGRQVNFPDQAVCFYGATMISAALLSAQRDNRAIEIDVAQRDVTLYLAAPVFEGVSAGAADDVRSIHETFKDHPLGDMVLSSDQRWVAISFYDEEDLSKIEGLKDATLVEWASQHNADEIEQLLRAQGIGASKCLHGSEMFKHPTVKSNQTFLMSPTKKLVKGFPFQFASTPMSVWSDAPKVGEHNTLMITEE